MLDRTRRIAAVYVEGLHDLLREFDPLITATAEREPTLFDRAALGAVLHALYQGIENTFTRISADVDHVLPGGDQWHRQLLDSMSGATARRPAVITDDLRQALSEYLGFRHVFRNVSPLDLDWERMAPLVARARETLDRLESELDAFFTRHATG